MKTNCRAVHGTVGWSAARLVGCAVILGMAPPTMAGVATSAADSGPGSLRQAITDANADGVATLITFAPEAFPATIVLRTRLPAVMGNGDVIDTQGLEVVIDGSELPDADAAHAAGIQVVADHVMVRGLTVQNFAVNGIYVGPSEADSQAAISNVTISGNTLLNNHAGIRVSGGCGPDNSINAAIVGNDLIDNLADGIVVDGSLNDCPGHNEVDVIIKNNWGENSSGSTELDGHSIRVLGGFGNGSNNRVYADVLSNQVSRNLNEGIVVAGAALGGASDNHIVAKIIGNTSQHNGGSESVGGSGIMVRGGSYHGIDPSGNGNTIQFEVWRNRCAGNRTYGIVITATSGANNTMHGNVAFNLATANGRHGVQISGAAGTGAHLRNIQVKRNRLFENRQDGISVHGGRGSNSFIENIALIRNHAHRNGRNGITLTRGAGSNRVSVDRIVGNGTILNANDGVFLESGVVGDGATLIAFNRSHSNGADGLDIDATEFVLKRNRAARNAADGISASGNTDGGGNVARGNASCNGSGCY